MHAHAVLLVLQSTVMSFAIDVFASNYGWCFSLISSNSRFLLVRYGQTRKLQTLPTQCQTLMQCLLLLHYCYPAPLTCNNFAGHCACINACLSCAGIQTSQGYCYLTVACHTARRLKCYVATTITALACYC